MSSTAVAPSRWAEKEEGWRQSTVNNDILFTYMHPDKQKFSTESRLFLDGGGTNPTNRQVYIRPSAKLYKENNQIGILLFFEQKNYSLLGNGSVASGGANQFKQIFGIQRFLIEGTNTFSTKVIPLRSKMSFDYTKSEVNKQLTDGSTIQLPTFYTGKHWPVKVNRMSGENLTATNGFTNQNTFWVPEHPLNYGLITNYIAAPMYSLDINTEYMRFEHGNNGNVMWHKTPVMYDKLPNLANAVKCLKSVGSRISGRDAVIGPELQNMLPAYNSSTGYTAQDQSGTAVSILDWEQDSDGQALKIITSGVSHVNAQPLTLTGFDTLSFKNFDDSCTFQQWYGDPIIVRNIDPNATFDFRMELVVRVMNVVGATETLGAP